MAEKEKKPKNIHAGHRERLREQFRQNGPNGFTDVQLLELLLCYSFRQGDTNEAAHKLLNHFGSFRAVLEADWQDIREIEGLGEVSGILIQLVRELNCRYIRYGRDKGAVLRSVDGVGDYIRSYFLYETEERVVMLSLDGQSRVVRTHVLAEGTPDRVDLPIRTLVDFALRDHAAKVVLAHNHLDHIAVPSNADIFATRRLLDALHLIKVELMDHLVFADDDFVSIRDSTKGFTDFNVRQIREI